MTVLLEFQINRSLVQCLKLSLQIKATVSQWDACGNQREYTPLAHQPMRLLHPLPRVRAWTRQQRWPEKSALLHQQATWNAKGVRRTCGIENCSPAGSPETAAC